MGTDRIFDCAEGFGPRFFLFGDRRPRGRLFMLDVVRCWKGTPWQIILSSHDEMGRSLLMVKVMRSSLKVRSEVAGLEA